MPILIQPQGLPARGGDQAGAGALVSLNNGCLPGRRQLFTPKGLQRLKRIETAKEVFNPKQPQRVKRIETTGKIFNPKQYQRVKRIETAEVVFNPKWLQKAKWIETLVGCLGKVCSAGRGRLSFSN